MRTDKKTYPEGKGRVCIILSTRARITCTQLDNVIRVRKHKGGQCIDKDHTSLFPCHLL